MGLVSILLRFLFCLVVPLISWQVQAELLPSPKDESLDFADQQPSGIWRLPAADRYVLIAELEKGSLRVFEKSEKTRLKEVASYPITIGKKGYGKQAEGDGRTPVGVYRIAKRRHDERADHVYGTEAYALNYPNVWDRLQQYSGAGIWIQGVVSGDIKRSLLNSDGSIVLADSDFLELARYLDVGYTKVISVPELYWQSHKSILIMRQDLQQRIEAWRKAWENRDPESYLNFYSRDFTDAEKGYEQWATYKRRVNTNKSYIKVSLSDLGLYQYPEQNNLVMAEFYQDYSSDRFKSDGRKRQLWRLENDNQWRIIYERGG